MHETQAHTFDADDGFRWKPGHTANPEQAKYDKGNSSLPTTITTAIDGEGR